MKNQFEMNKKSLQRFAKSCVQIMNELRDRVSSELFARFGGLLDEHRLNLVINEADALAATTPYPALLLPTLAEEKVRAAADWEIKQRELYARPLAMAA